MNLDIGERVHVDAWGADGTARVSYRGAGWTVVFRGDGAPRAGRARDRARSKAAASSSTPTLTEDSLHGSRTRRRSVIAVIFIVRTFKVVPQQHAWVVERLGKYDRTLAPGLKFLMPFVDRVAYQHSLKEMPLDVPSQVCITRDNTQLQVDGILYFQVTDPMRASYGSSQLRRSRSRSSRRRSLRSVIGKMELDKTFEERDIINASVVNALDEAALNWGVKVLRYEIKDLTPPAEILRAMQAQITAEREKRALIAASEGRQPGADQHRHRRARGLHRPLRGREAGRDQQGPGRGRGDHRRRRCHRRCASARSPRRSAQPGGEQAVQLKVAEQAVEAFAQLAQKNNTLIVPSNMTEVSALIASAMTLVRATPAPATR